MKLRLIPHFALALALCASISGGAVAAERVHVVIGKDAPALERLAASELAAQWKRLFDAEVSVSSEPPKAAAGVVWLGSPQSNSAMRDVIGDQWPKLTEQGFVLRSVPAAGGTGLIVGGGSPRATLWAVYELGGRFGVRYLTRDDIYPTTPIPLKLEGFDVVLEPRLRTRAWQMLGDSPVGYEAWPLKDQQRLLRQLAKLKFNRVTLTVYPWQPFVSYEFRGVKKKTAALWPGEKYTIPRDAPGRTALKGAGQFENPDFAGKQTYEQMTAAGGAYLQGVIDEAHRLGMSVGVAIRPLEFPPEFAAVLPGAKPAPGRPLTITPAVEDLDDPILKELAAAKLAAYLSTYPELDAICLDTSALAGAERHAERAWKDLFADGDSAIPALQNLIQTASKRKLAVQSNVVSLALYKSLFAGGERLQRPNRKPVELVVRGVEPALFPFLDRVLPPHASALVFADSTARRVVENREDLAAAPAGKVRARLTLTLADERIGVLSQSATEELETLVGDLCKAGWDGFSTRAWLLAELDPSVYFLSQAAWNPDATVRSTHDALFATITGKQSISDRLWLAFNHIEAATELIDQHDPTFASPAADMLMKHYKAEPAPKWWGELQERYTQAMVEFYRAHSNADPRARKLLFYWAKRGEYVLEYLNCIKALREAAIARKQGDKDKSLEQFETAIEQLYNALDTLSDVARDPGDRGLIAALIANAYRPLTAEYEKVADE